MKTLFNLLDRLFGIDFNIEISITNDDMPKFETNTEAGVLRGDTRADRPFERTDLELALGTSK